MNDDSPLPGPIIDSRLQTRKPEGQAANSHVGLPRHKCSQTRLVAASPVGKAGRPGAARSPAMGDVVIEKQGPGVQIGHPEPRLTGRERIVDYRKNRPNRHALVLHPGVRGQGMMPYLGRHSGRHGQLARPRISAQPGPSAPRHCGEQAQEKRQPVHTRPGGKACAPGSPGLSRKRAMVCRSG